MTHASHGVMHLEDCGFVWPSGPEAARVRLWVSLFRDLGTSRLIANCTAQMSAIRIEEFCFPTVLTQTQSAAQSYVASQYTHYIRYAFEEIAKVPNALTRALLYPLVQALAFWAKRIPLDTAVYLNNWLLSTNLWPDIPAELVLSAGSALLDRYPQRVLFLRSLDNKRCGPLLDLLKQNGYILLPSRLVYLNDTSTVRTHRDSRQDLALLDDKKFDSRDMDTTMGADFDRFASLYRQLYIDKYSEHNPQYTPEFFRQTSRMGLLNYRLVQTGQTVLAIAGMFGANGAVSCPVIGYDRTLPQDLALYRRACALFTNYALDHGYSVQHCSSGVGRFKMSRGARPAEEYTAVYCRHLPPATRLFWGTLQLICSSLAVPLATRYEL